MVVLEVLYSGCESAVGMQVLFDGKDIRSLNLAWLRSQMSLVGQEPHLFTGSIRDNIVYGKEDATEDEVIAAAKAANAYDFISTAPAGFHTLVSLTSLRTSRHAIFASAVVCKRKGDATSVSH